MASDASIYSMIRPQAQQSGPLDQYAQAMTIRHMLDQGDLAALQRKKITRDLDEEEATSAAYRESGGDPAKLRDILFGKGLFRPAMAAEKAGLERATAQATLDGKKAEILQKSLGVHRDLLSSVDTPQAAAQWVASGFADPVLAPVLKRIGSPEELVARIPQDPARFREWKMKNGLGIEKMLELTAPKPQAINAGGQTVIREMNANAPGFSNAPIAHTATPGDVMSDRRGWASINQPVWDSDRGVFVPRPGAGGGGAAPAAAPAASPGPRPAAATTAAPGVITPTGLPPKSSDAAAVVGTEGKLRDDFVKASGEFIKVRDAHQRVLASAKDPSAAGDLALIFNFMKTLDPGSTVREGEFATAQNSGGVPGWVVAKYNQVINGERLPDKVRADFVDRSGRIYQAAETNQIKLEDDYTGIATRSKANPQNVVLKQRINAGAKEPDKSVPGAAAPVRIAGDDGYNALPKGALYIGPDGVTRRKP